MTLSLPTLIPAAFASGSGPNKGLVNTLGTIAGGVLAAGPTLSPNASLMDGFPAVDMANPLAGGIAPSGADFNGAFNLVTAFQAWVNAGGKFPFNATLATAIGGYSIGNVVQLNSGQGEVVSLINGNTQDPNAAMTGWAPWAGPIFAVSQAATAFNAAGVAPAYTLTPSPALTALAVNDCYNVTFSATGTTGSNTLNVSGLGAKALMQYDLNGNLVPAVITSGLVAVCQYNGTYWVVLDALPSSTINSTQQTLVANEGNPANTVPIFKSGVLSTLKSEADVSFPSATTNYDLMPAANWLNTLTLPANFWTVGKHIKIDLWLVVNVPTSSMSLGLFLQGSNVESGGVVFASPLSGNVRHEVYINCLAVGAAGAAQFEIGQITHSYPASGIVGNSTHGLFTTGLSTLVAMPIDIQGQLSAVSSSYVHVVYGIVQVFA